MNIPSSITITYVALLLVTAAALLAVYRKTIVQSPAKNKYVPFYILLFLFTVQSVLALNNVFIDTVKNVPAPIFPAILSMVIITVYFAIYYKPLQNFDPGKMKYVVALHTFRLFLELIFAWLLAHGLLPVQMTFEGRNFDILVGLTAPFIAYFGYHKKALPKWLLVVWNIAGLILLFNIVTVAILSVPTNFQVFTNAPGNVIVLCFPYIFIPFFLVPLAMFLHLFSLRQLVKVNS